MTQTPMIYLNGTPDAHSLAEKAVLFQFSGDLPVETLTLHEALSRCADNEVTMVLGAAHATLTRVSLSRKQARHLERVLPFLLEENLLDSPDNLWFVSRKSQVPDEYLVTAISQDLIAGLVALAREAGIALASLQVDVERLGAVTPLRAEFDSGQQLLVTERDDALLVGPDQVDALLPMFGKPLEDATIISGDRAFFDQLRANQGQELLVRQFAPKKMSGNASALRLWRPLLAVAAAVLVLTVIGLRVQQWQYQQAADKALADAKQRYEQLFPGDKASSALKLQFKARLARLSAGGQGDGTPSFFPLLDPVATVLQQIKVEPKRIQYDQRQSTLLLDVGAKDYAQLEALKKALTEQGANASIANFRNGAQGVNARIMVEQPG